MGDFKWRECYTSYVNLDHREDRNIHIKAELERVGISAVRTPGLNPQECEIKYGYDKVKSMKSRSGGVIGCHYSQVSIMEKSLSEGKSAFIIEDDVIFSTDVVKRLDYVQDFLNENEWDIFWLGGTYYLDSPQWHDIGHRIHRMEGCTCNLGRDAERTSDPRMIRTYGCWGTYAYIINYNSLEKILKLLDENVSTSHAIDWLFIKLQPQLKTYAFNPGMAKQYDGQSDIVNEIRIFSNFSCVGPHWFSDFEPNL